jgi:hypothetical protein
MASSGEAIMDLLADDMLNLERYIEQEELEEVNGVLHDIKDLSDSLDGTNDGITNRPAPGTSARGPGEQFVDTRHSDMDRDESTIPKTTTTRKRLFKDISEADTSEFVRANENKNTAYKTKFILIFSYSIYVTFF